MSKVRVLLVDDHAILREGLRALLSIQPDIEVIGEAKNGEEAIQKVESLEPDIVLMDIAMPGINGLEATQLICQQFPKSRVIILSQHEDRQYVVPLLQAGASGYILKRAIGDDLYSAIRKVSLGETYLDPSLNTMIVEEIRQPLSSHPSLPDPLTQRELEVLKYIVHGSSNSQIAVKLSLSTKTVEWHRSNLMNKLDTHNVADLVRYALVHGLIDNELDDRSR